MKSSIHFCVILFVSMATDYVAVATSGVARATTEDANLLPVLVLVNSSASEAFESLCMESETLLTLDPDADSCPEFAARMADTSRLPSVRDDTCLEFGNLDLKSRLRLVTLRETLLILKSRQPFLDSFLRRETSSYCLHHSREESCDPPCPYYNVAVVCKLGRLLDNFHRALRSVTGELQRLSVERTSSPARGACGDPSTITPPAPTARRLRPTRPIAMGALHQFMGEWKRALSALQAVTTLV